MRKAFMLMLIAVLVSCTKPVEVHHTQDASTSLDPQVGSTSSHRADTRDPIDDTSQWVKQAQPAALRKARSRQKQEAFLTIADVYETALAKTSETRSLTTVLALAENYLKTYPPTTALEEEYLYIEAIIMSCFSRLGQYKTLLRFIDASASLRQTEYADPVRAYPLRMKADALYQVGKNEEAKQTYRKVLYDYGTSTREFNIALNNLDKIERAERE